MSDEMITLIRLLGSALFFIGFFVILYFIIRAIWRAIKRFTFEIIDRTHGTGTGASGASKKDYTREAREVCEKVTPKRKQDVTPPWEE